MLSTIDLLVLTSLFQLLLILKLLFTFLQKQGTLMRSPTVLSLPVQLVFLATTITMAKAISVTDVDKKYGKKVLCDRSLSSSVSWQTL